MTKADDVQSQDDVLCTVKLWFLNNWRCQPLQNINFFGFGLAESGQKLIIQTDWIHYVLIRINLTNQQACELTNAAKPSTVQIPQKWQISSILSK